MLELVFRPNVPCSHGCRRLNQVAPGVDDFEFQKPAAFLSLSQYCHHWGRKQQVMVLEVGCWPQEPSRLWLNVELPLFLVQHRLALAIEHIMNIATLYTSRFLDA